MRRRSAPRRPKDSTGEAPAGGHGGIHPPPRRFLRVEYPAWRLAKLWQSKLFSRSRRRTGGRQPVASVKATAREARSAWASVTWTSVPSGSGPSPVTRASTAGSCTVTVPRLSSFSSTSTTTPVEASPPPGAAARRPRPGRGPRSRTGGPGGRTPASSRAARASCLEHPAGHLGAGAQRDADLAGVAVAEPAQRRGHVGVLRGQRGVLGSARAPRRRSRRTRCRAAAGCRP